MELPKAVVTAFKKLPANTTIKLERVPMPSSKGRGKGKAGRLPFDLLKPPGDDGMVDSFLVPFGNQDPKRIAQRTTVAASKWKKKHPGVGLTMRTCHQEGGVRVYRIE